MSKNDHKVMVGCLLERVGDHVHWMIRNDASVYMASGTTSNGTEAVVIVATGMALDVARQVGTAMALRVMKHKDDLASQAESN